MNALIGQYSDHWQITSFVAKPTWLQLLVLFRRNLANELRQRHKNSETSIEVVPNSAVMTLEAVSSLRQIKLSRRHDDLLQLKNGALRKQQTKMTQTAIGNRV